MKQFALLICLLICSAIYCSAQNNIGETRLKGVVLNQVGAPIVNAFVLAINQENKKSIGVFSQLNGIFDLPVIPGTYTIKVQPHEKQLYQQFKIKNYKVSANVESILNIKLKVTKKFKEEFRGVTKGTPLGQK